MNPEELEELRRIQFKLDSMDADNKKRYVEALKLWDVVAGIRDKRIQFETECLGMFEGL